MQETIKISIREKKDDKGVKITNVIQLAGNI